MISMLIAIVVLGWTIVELINLVSRHTAGPELYGVVVASLAVSAGVLSLVLLKSSERRVLATSMVLVLWAVVAFGGLAGTAAHFIGPVAGHGPVDLRPRPIAAPLVFTLLSLIGGAALFFGQRAASRSVRNPWKE